MKKVTWGGLFALVFIAGIFTSFMPSSSEKCCKKNCDRGTLKERAWRESHRSAFMCCKKEACEKS